jgi:HD-GYP domain-containing protein (c-di-GMP phosphodiesterase class II)
MPRKRFKISLVYFVVFTLMLVGMIPLVLVGWFLSNRSAVELRAVENRYQVQLVQEKARQIEMFGQRNRDMVTGLADAFSLSNDPAVFASPRTDQQLSATLRGNPDLIALYVKPEQSESLALYRPGNIGRGEIDSIASKVIEELSNDGVTIGDPQMLGATGEPIITMASAVMYGDTKIASVTAIISLKRIARDVVGMDPTREADLWSSGLPIIFVVDQTGRTVFHPDPELMKERRPLGHLKIVDEWRTSYAQIQSGLVPFTADYEGNSHEMIGAYSTVAIGPRSSLGVVTMQDEARALASVGEMKTQAWLISLAFALAAMVFGAIAARKLTHPILSLSAAAENIAAGDLSSRVETRNITEIGTLGESFNTMSDKLEEHIAKLAKAATENRELFVGTVKALSAAIDGKDKYTRGHSERVARISVAIGRQLDLPEEELETLRISALLHDIGKIAIDDNILKKPAALTNEEYEIMKTHPVKGYKIMSQIPAMRDFLPGMYMHHEMVNGQGYPQGLTGDQIPLQGKIVSVADTFDAMTIDRPYSKGMKLQEALDQIRKLVGTRYDGAVVEALVRGCDAGEIGRGVVQSMASAERAGEKPVNVGVASTLAATYNPEDPDHHSAPHAPVNERIEPERHLAS